MVFFARVLATPVHGQVLRIFLSSAILCHTTNFWRNFVKTALLVIDIQNDYFPGGKNPVVNALEAAQNAYMLLQCFREMNGYHVHIQHISLKPDATFLMKGDSGSDIHDSVSHFEGEPIVYKHYANSFRDTNLLEMLKEWEIERVVICGMMTHMCVDA